MQQIGWVVLGLLSALGLGFALGLARPHPETDIVAPTNEGASDGAGPSSS